MLNLDATYIIIPAFNEDPGVLHQVADQFRAFRILIVDDGSKLPVRESLADFPPLPNLEILRLETNSGQGAALEAGVQRAFELGAEVFCTVDGDGQHDPESCRAILEEFASGSTDILLGSRFLENRSRVPLFKRMFLKGGIYINYFYSGLLLHDAHCGLRVFGRKVAENLHFYNKRQAHASEILWLIQKYGWSYSEYPVRVVYSAYSIQKGQSVWNSFRILKHLIKHRFNRR